MEVGRDLARDVAAKGYRLCEEIGSGTFSVVYRSKYKDSCTDKAVKIIHPTSKPDRILNELKHLEATRGCPNVVEFLDAFRIPSGGFAIVFPLVEHDDFLAIVQRCTMQDIRYYMRALLQALAHVHAKGIIHRDVKPRNFLYNVKRRSGLLIDFGLAQNVRASTPVSAPVPAPDVDGLEAEPITAAALERTPGEFPQAAPCDVDQLPPEPAELPASMPLLPPLCQPLADLGLAATVPALEAELSSPVIALSFSAPVVSSKKRPMLASSPDSASSVSMRKRASPGVSAPTKGRQPVIPRTVVDLAVIAASAPVTVAAAGAQVLAAPATAGGPIPGSMVYDKAHRPVGRKSLPFSSATTLAVKFSFVSSDNAIKTAKRLSSSPHRDIALDSMSTSVTDGSGAAERRRGSSLVDSAGMFPTKASDVSVPVLGAVPESFSRERGASRTEHPTLWPVVPPTAMAPPALPTSALPPPAPSRVGDALLRVTPPLLPPLSPADRSILRDLRKRPRLPAALPGAVATSFMSPFALQRAAAKPHQKAERAGTPGFRAPEVLLRVKHQTTAIDIWSAGVMLCSLLCRRYPLFYTAHKLDAHVMAQVMLLLGAEAVERAAVACGKVITEHPFSRERGQSSGLGQLDQLVEYARGGDPDLPAAVDLVRKCLDPNPATRLSALAALQHPFLQ